MIGHPVLATVRDRERTVHDQLLEVLIRKELFQHCYDRLLCSFASDERRHALAGALGLGVVRTNIRITARVHVEAVLEGERNRLLVEASKLRRRNFPSTYVFLEHSEPIRKAAPQLLPFPGVRRHAATFFFARNPFFVLAVLCVDLRRGALAAARV